ncbi:MAG: MBL fold metallo-hydrolase [Clostridiales bacterium]|nr:MBL fold metallo-hydrolase [Clostridiales bacterium]
MRIKIFVTPGMEENCYVIICMETKKAIVVDPGADMQELFDFIKNEDLTVEAIVLTHAHYDHIGGLKRLKAETQAPVVCGEDEAPVLKEPNLNLSLMFGAEPFSMTADRLLKDGEEFSFGSLKFKTLFTPGHTQGGICLYFEEKSLLISGDSLFAMSIGRTDFPGGGYRTLINGLKEKVMTLPDDTVVYPGHGPKTTIAVEKKHNPYLG